VDYSPFQSASNALTNNVSYLPDGTQTPGQFHIYTPSSQKIDIFSAKADYNSKIFRKYDFSTGVNTVAHKAATTSIILIATVHR
jgi:hypothetical protein